MKSIEIYAYFACETEPIFGGVCLCVRFLKMNDTVMAIRFMSMPSTSTKVDSKQIPHLMCTQSIETRWKRYIFNLQQLTLDHMLAFI